MYKNWHIYSSNVFRACKFRFELTFDEFDPSEIARKTDKGLFITKNVAITFCDCVIQELQEQIDLNQQ
jgi:hypothetical protein